MEPFIAAKISELQALCRQHSVRRLELFGSAAAGGFDAARSDLDFVVEFLAVPRHGLKDVYFALLRDLELLFGRDVDLVERSAVRNPYFSESLERTKVPVYVAA